MKLGRVLTSILFASLVSPVFGEDLKTDVDEATLTDPKLSPLGLYISSKKAYELLNEEPEILFIDVRDPVEVALTGHPEPVDKIVPVRLQSDVYDKEIEEFALVPNSSFLKEMKQTLKESGKSRHDAIFVTCGSGYRSGEAVRILSAAGYTNVWQIPDGYDGEEKRGMNSQNAWQNAGLPWSRKLVPSTPWVKVFRKTNY